MISEVNLHILRIINTAAKPGHEKSSKHEQNFITKLVDRYVSNPIIKKELHYTFRSPRELLNYGVIIYFYIYTAWMVLSDGVSKLGLHHVLLIMQMFFLFMHILIILQYCGNFFRYDYEGVINYFYRPISYSYLIRSKTFPFNIILIFNILFALIMLIITGIKPAGFLLFISLIIILYHSGSAAGTLLSIYFPKRVNLYGLTGSNVTFWSFIITLLSASILIGLCYPMIKDFSGVFKIFVSIILLIFSLKIYYSQERINSIFAKILIKRKERIINVCR